MERLLFIVFGTYVYNNKVLSNFLQVKASDLLVLEKEETPLDMTDHVHIFVVVLIKN